MQSECDSKEYGGYTCGNNITLNGSIYYGSSSNVNVVIDEIESGVIVTGSNAINYEVDEENKVITIDKFIATSTSGMVISSSCGSVKGDVTIYSSQMVQNFNISNNTSYAIKVNSINLSVDEEQTGNYSIETLYNQLHVIDASTATTLPVIGISMKNGADVILSGKISNYSAVMKIIFGEKSGNVYMTKDAQIDLSQLYIKNANSIGTAENTLVVNLYSIQDEKGVYQKPVINLEAKNDINVEIVQKQLVTDISEGVINTKILDGFEEAIFNAGKNLNVTFNGSYLLVLESTTKEELVDYAYTYTKNEYTFVDIAQPLTANIQKDADGNYIATYYYTADCVDADGNIHKQGELYTYDTDLYDAVATSGKTDRYYLVEVTVDEEGNEIINKTYIDASVEEYTDEEGNVHYTCEEYLSEESEDKYIIKSSNEYIYQLVTIKEVEVTEYLDETVYVNDTIIVPYAVSGIYNVTQASGENVIINAYSSLKENKDTLILGDITGQNSVKINAYNNMTVVVDGVVCVTKKQDIASKEDIDVNATGKLIFNKGTIGDNTTDTYINISAYDLETTKTSGYDIVGKSVNIVSTVSTGSSENPIRILTSSEGINAQALADSVYITAGENSAYVKYITSGNIVSIEADSIYNAEKPEEIVPVVLAKHIILSAANQIGTSEDGFRVEVGTSGIEAYAENDIYLLSNKAIYLTKLQSGGLVKINVLEGNMYNSSGNNDIATIEAENISLEARKGAIGDTLTKNGYVVVTVKDSVLTAQALDNVAIGFIEKANVSYIESISKDVILKGDDDIIIQEVISPNDIEIYTKGIADIRKANAANVLNITTLKGIKLSTVTAKKVVMDSKGDILTNDSELVNIIAENTNISARNIGTKTAYIVTDIANDIYMYTTESIYAKNIGKITSIAQIDAKEDVYFNALKELYVYKLDSNNAYIVSGENMWCGHMKAINSMSLTTEQSLYSMDTDAIDEKYEVDKVCVTVDILKLEAAGSIGNKGKAFITDMEGENSKVYVQANEFVYLEDLDGIINIMDLVSNTSYVKIVTNGDTNIYNVLSEKYIDIDTTNGDANIYYAQANENIDIDTTNGNIGLQKVVTPLDVYITSTHNIYNINEQADDISIKDANIEAVNLYITTGLSTGTDKMPVITNVDMIKANVGENIYIINLKDLYISDIVIKNDANIYVYGNASVQKAESEGSFYITAAQDVTGQNIKTGRDCEINAGNELNVQYINAERNNKVTSGNNTKIEKVEIKGDNDIDAKGSIIIKTAYIDGGNFMKAVGEIDVKEFNVGMDNTCITDKHIEVLNSTIHGANNIQTGEYVYIRNMNVKSNNTIISEGYVEIDNIPIEGDSYITSKEYIFINNINSNGNGYVSSDKYVIINNLNTGKNNEVISKGYVDIGSVNTRGSSRITSEADVDIDNLNVIKDNTIITKGHLTLKYSYISFDNKIIADDYIDIISINIWGNNYMKSDKSLKANRIEVANENIMIVDGDVVIGEFTARGSSKIVTTKTVTISNNMAYGGNSVIEKVDFIQDYENIELVA